MKKSLSVLMLCGVFLTACASRATNHEDVPPAPTTESGATFDITHETSQTTAEATAAPADPTAEVPAATADPIADSAEPTAEAPNSTQEAISITDDRGNPGLEPGTAFRFNGADYFFEIPADLAVISPDGGLVEWQSDGVHNDYLWHFDELEDVSDNAALNECDSGKWYLASDGTLLHLRQVTQEEYDSVTGFGVDCPPENVFLLKYELENIYNVLFYTPAN
ncbi:MAG: hypothetical protein ACI4WS_07545 [Oscillospiraceae bacterium]